MTLQFAPLSRQHNRAAFDCGDEEMNEFVHHYLAQQVKSGETSCYVLEESESYEMLGLFTLSPGSLQKQDFPGGEKFAYPQAGVYLLGRLAVSKCHHGKGYAKLMVEQAVTMLTQPDVPRALGLLTELKRPELKSFYHKLGFVEITPNKVSGRVRMFFPFSKPRKLPSHPTTALV